MMLIDQGITIWFNAFEEALYLCGINIIMHVLWVFMVFNSIFKHAYPIIYAITREEDLV